MVKKDARLRKNISLFVAVVAALTTFLLTRDPASKTGAQTVPVTSAATPAPTSHSEAVRAAETESVREPASASAAPRLVYRFETPVATGKPAAIPARFSTPSAAETVIRSARLAELIDGSLAALRQGDTISLPLPGNRFAAGRINVVQREADGQVVVGGELTGDVKGSFTLGEDDSRLSGMILPTEGLTGYEIETGRDGAAYLLEKNKGSIVCLELPMVVASRVALRDAQAGAVAESAPVQETTSLVSAAAAAEYSLSSRPTATAVAYLDFDGETVTDAGWNNGNVINASSSGLTPAQITEVWQRVAEDYRPFNIDVTTDRSRYDNAPAGSRIRCIITRSHEWYGSAGGVAYIGSWSAAGSGGMSSTVPCWAFVVMLANNPRYIAEAASHEIGHTLGLSHDGVNTSSGSFLTEYYSGHGTGATSWAPIMGSGYYNSVVQWSNGEYNNNGKVGNNTENDLAIISDARNRAGYMTDDAGNTRATAAALRFNGSAVSTVGLIERSGDADVYSFTTSGGAVSFALAQEFSGRTGQANLDARATLYDASGNVLGESDPAGSLYPTLSTTVGAGTYYLAITGVGEGAVPGTGYTNYGSLGRYEITGSVVSSGPQAPSITSAASGSAVRGSAFSHQITASNSPTSYGASGLVSGLSINSATGLISGTVSTSVSAGVYTFGLTATNATGSGTQNFSLTITNPIPPAPAITSVSTGSGVTGSAFTHQITASNSPTSYAASGLPSGLSINTSTGLISGTLSSGLSAGVYSITLSATNAGGTGSQTFALTLTKPVPSAPVISSANTGSGIAGSSFSHQITASNSPTSYAASTLPSGLSINTSTGRISGTLSSGLSAGAYSITLSATNAGGTGSQTFTLTVTRPLPPAPVISSSASGSGVAGSAFSHQITASNSPTAYAASSLPAGLSIHASTGLISGTLSSSLSAGAYSITLSATNAGGTAYQTFTLTVTRPLPPAPAITSVSAGTGTAGSVFSHQITAGNNPVSYAASNLPTGLNINTSTGVVSGVLSSDLAAGVYSFTLSATNAGGTGSQTFTLTVSRPLPSAPSITSPGSTSGVAGSAFSFQITATNSPTSFTAAGLPAGLSINTNTGLISGTIQLSVAPRTYVATLAVKNAGGTSVQWLSIVITSPVPQTPAPVITSASSARVAIGVAFSHQVVASNSPDSYEATGLPAGISIDTTTGLISGATSTMLPAGVYPVTVKATNAGGSATQVLSLDIKSAYAAWAQDRQIEDINTTSLADPDGDGLGNLIEYAFDRSPSSAESSPIAEVNVVTAADGTPCLEITFDRPANRPDLIYTVEVSSDMKNWSLGHSYGAHVVNSSGLATQEIAPPVELQSGAERIRVRDIGGSGNQRFIRVKVTSL